MEKYIAKTLKESKEPFKVLTFDELEAGFVISVAPLLLAMLVFCFEWIVALKDLVVWFCIFKSFFNARQKSMEAILQSESCKLNLWKTLQSTDFRKYSRP